MTRRGSLLIVTLWLIAVLSMLSVAISHRMAMELRLVRHRIAQVQAYALARGAIRYGTALLVVEQAQEAFDWMGDDWTGTAQTESGPPSRGEGDQAGVESPPREALEGRVRLDIPDGERPSVTHTVTLQIVDEERRLSLNHATPSQLLDLGVSEAAAQAILDAIDADEPDDPSEDRADLDVPYIAKDAPLVTMAELSAIPAFRDDPDSLPPLLAHATVYTDGRINANTASIEVLLAVKGGAAPDQILQAMVAQRAGADGRFGTFDDCVLRDHAEAVQDLATCLAKGFDEVTAAVAGLSPSSLVFMLAAEPLGQDGRPRAHVEAVINRSQSPATIVAWRQD
jgi:type II secretory pathway component PulK